MSLFNIRALKNKQLTSKLAVASLLAGGLTVAPFFAGADGGYTVPAGADVIQVVAVGGSGGSIGSVDSGGKGCELSASFEVSEGDVFSESLGGNGGNGELGNATSFVSGGAGGFGAEGRNGGKGGDFNFLTSFRGSGSGGGGATSVYLNGTEVAISAGGGGGSSSASMTGGSGCANNTLDGGAGAYGLGGGGGTSSAGGIGGAARAGDGLPGQNGSLGVGAAGSDATQGGNGMSNGGGGGYYGGGSSPSWAGCCSASGGGAGSSWAATPALGIKAATGKAATATSAQVTYYAIDFPTQTLAEAPYGLAYNADLTATFKSVELNNAATAIWTVSPSLPAGLSLNSATGAITGTATEQASNDYEFKAAWKSGSDIVARSIQTIHLAVGEPPTTPGPPTLTGAIPTFNGVELTWTAPTSAGATAITDYTIQWSSDDGETWTTIVDSISTSTSASVIGLADFTAYKFRIQAVNDDGPGSSSNILDATTTSRTPGAPSITSATVVNTNVTLEWTPPSHIGDAAITDYVIEYSRDGGGTWLTFNDGISTSTTAIVRNLQQLTSHRFRVSAVNNSGTGLTSPWYAVTTELGVPGQVELSVVRASSKGITVFWNSPDAGGAPISDYIVEYSVDGGNSWSVFEDGPGVGLDAHISGLTPMTRYFVRVAAVNDLGVGDFSQPVKITTKKGVVVTPTPTPTPTETSTPTPTPTSTKPPKPTPTPTKTAKPKPKPSATTTPSATPSESATEVPTNVLDVLAEPYKHKGAIVELDPSKSLAYENGAAVEVELIQKSTKDGYILEGSFFDLELAATSESGDPVELNEDGHLVLEKDRYATFNGSGFAPNTPVQVWLFSTPTALKRVVTDENGNFSGSALVPAGIPVGEHTVQLNGISEDGKVRSVSLGVLVEQPATELAPAAFDWAYLVMWLVFGLLLIAVFWWFIVARRRKREDEQTA